MSEETPQRIRPAAGHRIPDDQWAKIEADAKRYAAEAPPRAAGPRGAPAINPVVDMTAAGRNCGKYFPVSGIPTQLIVFHSMECPLAPGYARSLTDWALTPESAGGPQASWHRGYGPDARVYFIPDELGAWHASEANVLSIGLEQAGYAAYTRAQWTTPDGLDQLETVAYDVAAICKRDGIPARWLTTAEVRAVLDGGNRTIKGFCYHRQVDPETRTDPGDGYPADLLLTLVKKYLGTAPQPPTDWFDMATQAQLEASIKKIVEPLVKANTWAYKGAQAKDAFWHLVYGTWATTITRGGKKNSALQELADTKTLGLKNEAAIKALQTTLDAVLKAVAPSAPAAAPRAAEARPDIDDVHVDEAPETAHEAQDGGEDAPQE
jgi:hypothetical protein